MQRALELAELGRYSRNRIRGLGVSSLKAQTASVKVVI